MGRLTTHDVVSLINETGHSEAWKLLQKVRWRDRWRLRLLLKLIEIQDLKRIHWALSDVRSALEERETRERLNDAEERERRG